MFRPARRSAMTSMLKMAVAESGLEPDKKSRSSIVAATFRCLGIHIHDVGIISERKNAQSAAPAKVSE